MACFFSVCHSFSFARLSVHTAWVSLFHQGGWMTAFCREFLCLVGRRVRSFNITPVSDLNGYLGFRLGSWSGFCGLKTTGRWSLPLVSARVHGAGLGDNTSRSSVLSVSPCSAPRCPGVTVDTGVKRTPVSASSMAYPCWMVACQFCKRDRALKSPPILTVSPSSSSIFLRSQLPPVVQQKGRACMH